MKIIRIYPKTNFHTYLHSDTLWGNLVYAYKLLYDETALEKLLENYLKGIIPFVVSSVFPYEIIKNGSEQIVYYFPKPLLGGESIKAESPEDMTLIKDFKSIRFVEKRIFEEYLNGNLNDKSLFDRFKLFRIEESKKKEEQNENVIKENKFRYLKNITAIYNLHNSIDRMRGSTLEAEGRGQLYWEDEFTLGKEMGLFFLAELSELNVFESLLRLLSHIGIGGNRSIGKGSFEFEIDEPKFNSPSEYNGYISLSLYHPSEEELNILASENTNLFYDITTRIGFVGKDFNNVAQEKNPVNCFTEGSTFYVKEKLKGCLVSTAKINEQKDVYSNYLFFGVKGNLRSI